MFARFIVLIQVVFISYTIHASPIAKTKINDVKESEILHAAVFRSQNHGSNITKTNSYHPFARIEDDNFPKNPEDYFGKKYFLILLDRLKKKLKYVYDLCKKAKCDHVKAKPRKKTKLSSLEVCKNIVGVSKPIMCTVLENNLPEEKNIPKSCKEIYNKGNKEPGIYLIQPSKVIKPFYVPCEMLNKGGGWTTIQRRTDGSENFFRNWRDYVNGFGTLTGEFWIGLERIHHITKAEKSQLLVELVDVNNENGYALYDDMKVGNEISGFLLESVGKYSGNAGDSMCYKVGAQFSTIDFDQDSVKWLNCADHTQSAFWFRGPENHNHCEDKSPDFQNYCFWGIPTGYVTNIFEGRRGVLWLTWRRWQNLKRAAMFLKPA